jgi:hypothetical protein
MGSRMRDCHQSASPNTRYQRPPAQQGAAALAASWRRRTKSRMVLVADWHSHCNIVIHSMLILIANVISMNTYNDARQYIRVVKWPRHVDPRQSCNGSVLQGT